MLFLRETNYVGCEADHGLDFLLGITEVGVSDHCDDDSRLWVSVGQFEWSASVVELFLVLPGHSVILLALCGLVPVWETTLFLCEVDQVGC